MNEAAAALVASFEGAAKRAQDAETILRKKVAEEIARLERQRAFAFRRARLVGILATSAEGLEKEDEAASAQSAAVGEELGWGGESPARIAILDEMKPLGLSVWRCVCGGEDASPEEVTAEIERFETWFESKHGTPFYALFDQYVPEVPLVDF
jgi:hypothetical protein